MANGLFEEMVRAFGGAVALVRGKRQASDYFDLTYYGLIGSLVAFLAATGVDALLTGALSTEALPILAWQSLFLSLVLYALQVGFSAIVLNQIKRLDALVPYLVAENWVTFYLSLAMVGFALLGNGSDFALMIIWVVALIAKINTARLIMTLTAMQIVIFLVAQLVAAAIGLIAIASILPIPLGV